MIPNILSACGLAIGLIAIQCASPVAHAAEQPVHVVILSGQSNMAGMNPALGFEPEAKEKFGDAKVVYFKVASGGKPIRLWVKEWNAIAKRSGIDAAKLRSKERNMGTVYYEPILNKYKELLKKHPKPASVTFCWMQGERDAREKLSAAYGESLTQLISSLRRDLNRPNMKFVIGRLSDFGKANDEHWQAIRKAQIEVASKDPHGAWVDCDDLNDKTKNGVTRNDLHYTKAGYELLGRRYIRQAKALIEGEKTALDGRPN